MSDSGDTARRFRRVESAARAMSLEATALGAEDLRELLDVAADRAAALAKSEDITGVHDLPPTGEPHCGHGRADWRTCPHCCGF